MHILEILERMKSACPVKCDVSVTPVEGGIQLVWGWAIKDKYDKRKQYALGKTLTSMDMFARDSCAFEELFSELSSDDFRVGGE